MKLQSVMKHRSSNSPWQEKGNGKHNVIRFVSKDHSRCCMARDREQRLETGRTDAGGSDGGQGVGSKREEVTFAWVVTLGMG